MPTEVGGLHGSSLPGISQGAPVAMLLNPNGKQEPNLSRRGRPRGQRASCDVKTDRCEFRIRTVRFGAVTSQNDLRRMIGVADTRSPFGVSPVCVLKVF